MAGWDEQQQRLLLATTTTTTPSAPTSTPTSDALAQAEVEHTYDAVASLWLNIILIVCILAAYAVKHWRLYYLPESALAIGIGMVVGVMARLTTDHLELWVFSPELFFFVFLPPIIFEAGYSLNQKDFFDNIGAIVMFAMVGTIISTFTVGGITWYVAHHGWVTGFNVVPSPMEALLFGSLISAVDPVATLSIMGNAELRCDRLLYSLVFGESVLNDAIAISLFRVFADYYEKENSSVGDAEIADAAASSSSATARIFSALIQFTTVSASSIAMGAILGLAASAVYRHTGLRHYPKLETSLLFLFCYTCYSLAEAVQLSGIMALFFQGMVLSHYNSYNLSAVSVTASEQIFATLATLAETAVFLYMGTFQYFHELISYLTPSRRTHRN